MADITHITETQIFKASTTKTIVAKTYNFKTKLSFEDLKKSFEGSYITKFKNCVLKKIDNKCVKLYTNLTIQLSGVSEISETISILNNLSMVFKPDYIVECVMSNWTIRISTREISLNKTMDNINKDDSKKYLAYFLRGYPLIIKYKLNTYIENLIISSDSDEYKIKNIHQVIKDVVVSILVFKSGNCIVSGPSEKSCAEAVFFIKTKIIH